MALKYTTVVGFVKHAKLQRKIPDVASGTVTPEKVAPGNSSDLVYLLQRTSVINSTLVLTTTAGTTLVETTDYAQEDGIITLTTAGKVALGNDTLLAKYTYISEDTNLLESEMEDMLEDAESGFEEEVETVFADQTSSTPDYNQVTDELQDGQGFIDKQYRSNFFPLVKLQTTVASNFTLGDTTLTLTDASGFPETGTIYVGGNKVTYSARSTNDLTVPNTTPTVAADAVVRGEVIEVSLDPEGVTVSFQVLTPDVDYAVDYDTGRITLLDDFYGSVPSTFGLTKPENGVADRVRFTYMNAWHKLGKDCTVPNEIRKIVYMMTMAELADTAILSSNATFADNFSPTAINSINARIKAKINKYKSFNVSSV